MKTTQEYLEAAKTKLMLPSDYAAARWLGVNTSALSHYKTGRRVIDDYAAAKIADALGIPEMEVIAAANYEREKDEKRREFWRAKITPGLAASVMIFAGISMDYGNSQSAFCILC